MIVALDSATDAQRDEITNFLRQQGWNVWHWLSNVWLLADIPPETTPRDLWTRLESIAGPQSIKGLVMMTGQETKYWGSNDTNSWKWMDRFWAEPDFSQEELHRMSYHL